MIKVMSSGVFDVLNLGHINILTQAKQLGDKLIVGIQDDDSVKKYKGQLPILNITERAAQISALPFVDEIIVYDNIDQRDIWKELKPDIIVQGDDYIQSGDRSDTLKFLKENKIRLILLPRTNGISSTEIKRRIVHENRKDIEHLKQIKMMELSLLDIYEEFDRKKVEILKKKILLDGFFDRPIVVGQTEDFNIVVDGNNRLQAIKELGYQCIPCLVLPYLDVDLTNNVHFVNGDKITRLSEFSVQTREKIIFDSYSHQDIINFIRDKKTIPSGQTWHRPSFYVINMEIPLKNMNLDFDMVQHINKLMDNNNIRFYPLNVYSCNEWGNKL